MALLHPFALVILASRDHLEGLGLPWPLICQIRVDLEVPVVQVVQQILDVHQLLLVLAHPDKNIERLLLLNHF